MKRIICLVLALIMSLSCMLVLASCDFGGSGSGKSLVSRMLCDRGIPYIDADAVYSDLVSGESACLSELVLAFGDSIISPDGSLNRRAMADLVFSGEGAAERRRLLNSITHRHVLDEIRHWLDGCRDSGAELAVVDAPLLFESGFDRECNLTVAVVADRELRIRRICERDGLDRAAAERRIDAQLSSDELSSRVDRVIYNNGSLDELFESACRLVDEIRKFDY